MNDTQPVIDGHSASPTDTRLIERWLPIAALGEESVRERRSMTALPPIYYLHVWWARRPLIASRAAILGSVLSADASHEKFLHALGIHGDPVASRRRIDAARRKGERFEGEAYTYSRAFSYVLSDDDRRFVKDELTKIGIDTVAVLDPTAGGGSIPFEAARLQFNAIGNDLNPVAALIEKATIEYPLRHGISLIPAFRKITEEFVSRREGRLAPLFPTERDADCIATNYLWARTVRCPYCDGLVPLAPNWRLAPNGTGIHLQPCLGTGPGDRDRRCEFMIVSKLSDHSVGTVLEGDGTCPFPDCGRLIEGDKIKEQAQAGEMGEQLFAIVFKQRIETRTKSGKRGRNKWRRGYRAPRTADDNSIEISVRLAEKVDEWAAFDILPSERIGHLSNYDRGHRMYGMESWIDLFNPRQLLGHGLCVEVFRELLSEKASAGLMDDVTSAAFVYLAIAIDKLLDYNSRMTRWHSIREVMVNTFDSHNFAHRWSYAEMTTMVAGVGYDWVIEQVTKCIGELVELAHPETAPKNDLLSGFVTPSSPDVPITITCKPGDALDHIVDASVDVVVIDPPYYDNVMYAELSDFFYVWLKRTAGHVVPELFTRQLTDKENEAVANVAKFAGQKGAKALAGRDYQERMARIFEECRRVLKPTGIMTLMFTHKATGAWDALTKGLMEANFIITASWPINTEAEGSLHIKDKSAANSTIFLVCRPRLAASEDTSTSYWEDVERLVARAVRARVTEFQQAGISGVDLYLACFGPALEEFSRHWPLKRGTPRHKPEALRRRRQAEMFEEEWNPYAVTPEDALDAARREVKRWRLEQLTHLKANEEVDPLTSFFVLAWDAFKAPVFPYDEALRLARAVGVDLDNQVVGVLVEKKGSDLVLWDSARRAAKGALGPADGSRSMIDTLHHVAHLGRTRTLQAGRELLTRSGLDKDQRFFAALEAVLEVLPVSKAFSGIDLEGDLAAAGSDFEALENLRKLAFTEQVDAPKQLELWQEIAAA
jgi:putative DNA methylase